LAAALALAISFHGSHSTHSHCILSTTKLPNEIAMQAVTKRCRRPISCAGYQGPCLPVPARSFRTSTVNNNNDNQTEPSQDTPPASDDGYSNVQINAESKTVTTAVGELPISPLMDPAFHEARLKFTKPKPQRQEHKLTKFQRQLARSPYGNAPSQPVARHII
jgi:hypothetical protein